MSGNSNYVEYPKEMIAKAKAISPRPTFVEGDYFPDARKCMNCGDRGFMVAFYCDYDKSLIAGRAAPVLEKGKCLKSIDGAWWVGSHETYDCPVCANG